MTQPKREGARMSMWIRIGKDTTWPRIAGDKFHQLEWDLRYGNPTKESLLAAASVLSAYRSLVTYTQKRRNEICKELQRVEAP